MHVGTNHPRNKYCFDEKELPKIKNEKDVGVLVLESLSWRFYIDSVVKKQ